MKKVASSYRLILGYLGIFIAFAGFTCLIPLLLLFAYPNESQYWLNFFAPGIGAIAFGITLYFLFLFKKETIKLGKHLDSVLLVLIWISAILICGIPFFLRKDMTFTEGVFETTSGFSTIGLTVFKDFDCHIYVFYRSLVTLIGGVGLVLIITTAISDKYGLKLYLAEGHNDKLLPNLKKSAALMLSIYLGIIVLGVIAYVLAGVPLFDAIIHSISAVATGGFSSKEGGIVELGNQYGNLPAIEIISLVLMVLGATNFLTNLFIITGKFSKVMKDCEVRFFVSSICIFVPLFFVATLRGGSDLTVGESFRYGAFTFFSAITTTGFSNVADVRILGEATMALIILINVIGGGMGSTAGGVKQYRVVVALKSFYWATKARLSPSRMIIPHFVERSGEDKEVSHRESIEAFGYIGLYVLIMFLGGFLICVFGKYTFNESLFEFSNAISSTGLSNGLTKAASTASQNGVLWTLICGMFAGRLEILAIYFAFFRVGRDILGKETY